MLDGSCLPPALATTERLPMSNSSSRDVDVGAFFSSPFHVTLHSIVRAKQWACCQHEAFEEILSAAASGLREPSRPRPRERALLTEHYNET